MIQENGQAQNVQGGSTQGPFLSHKSDAKWGCSGVTFRKRFVHTFHSLIYFSKYILRRKSHKYEKIVLYKMIHIEI